MLSGEQSDAALRFGWRIFDLDADDRVVVWETATNFLMTLTRDALERALQQPLNCDSLRRLVGENVKDGRKEDNGSS